MENTIEKIMQSLVEQYGKELYLPENELRFKGLLFDFASDFAKELKTLKVALAERIPAKLLSCDGKDDEEKLLIVKDSKQNPENTFNEKLRQKKIIEAIEKLPSKQREVIVLYDMHDMSYEQIAKKINCPVGTVRSRLYNARKELAEKLKELL